MPNPRPSHQRTALVIGTGLLLGYGLGFAARPAHQDVPAEVIKASSDGTASAGTTASATGAKSKAATRSSGAESGPAGTVTFTREQWKHLLRKGYTFNISVNDCIQWQRTEQQQVDFDREWGFEGFSPKVVEGGPDLEPVARFLGLDDIRKEKLGDSLHRFGQELRQVEHDHAAISYGSDGSARISFGDGSAARQALLARLEQEVVASLGERDGRRFVAVSGLFGDKTLPDEMEIRIEETDQFIRTTLEGYSEVFMFKPIPEDKLPGKDEHAPRLQHLDIDVDWARLSGEAKRKAQP